ncbi:hypothetical protein [Hymenobacter fastidiosus]
MSGLSSIATTLRHHLGTLALSFGLALGVAYYVLGYLPQRKKELEQRYFRVLTRTGQNLRERVKVYAKINEGAANAFICRNFPRNTSFAGSRSQATIAALTTTDEQRQIERRWSLLNPHIADLRFDSLKNVAEPQRPKKKAYGRMKVIYRQQDHSLVYSLTNVADPTTGRPAAYGRTGVIYRQRDHSLVFRQRLWQVDAPPKLPRTDSLNLVLQTTVATEKFIAGLARTDAFEHFFVANDAGELLYASQPNVLEKLPVAALAKRDSAEWQTRPLSLNGQPCQLFVQHLRLPSGQTWLLAGTVPLRTFQAEQRSLPSGLSELLMGGLLLGVLLVPFLKVGLLSQRERLDASDVWLCVGALILGAGVVTLILQAELTRRYPDLAKTDRQLRTLADTVQHRLTTEIRDLNAIIKLNDSTRTAIVVQQAGDTSQRNRYRVPHFQPLQSGSAPRRLPLEDDALVWVTKAGIGTAAAVPSPEKSLLYVPDLRGRAYVQAAFAKRWQRLTLDSGQTDSANDPGFILDGIVSYREAKRSAVLVRKTSSGVGPSDTLICAYITKLRTFINPVLPPNWSFCLIDQQGEILFHSNPALGLSENLLADCEEPRLGAALTTGEPGALDVRYQGQDHRLYVRPLPALRMALVTLVDMRVVKAQHSQAVALAAALLSAVWLLLLGGAGLLRQLRHQHPTAGLPPLRFRSTWPCSKRAVLYLILGLLALAGSALMLLVFIPFEESLARLGLLLLLPLVLYPVSKDLLHRESDQSLDDDQRAKRDPGRQIRWSLLGLLGLNVGLVFSLQQYWYCLLVYQLLLVIIIAGVLGARALMRRVFKKYLPPTMAPAPPPPTPPPTRVEDWVLALRPWLLKLRPYYRQCYALMLLGWLVAMSILPAVVCYQTSYRLVRLLHVRETHLDLLRQLRDANHPNSPRLNDPDSVQVSVARKANWSTNYFTFYFQTQFKAAETKAAMTSTGDALVRRFYPSAISQLSTLLPAYLLPHPDRSEQRHSQNWHWNYHPTPAEVRSFVPAPGSGNSPDLVSVVQEPEFSANWLSPSAWASYGVPAALVALLLLLALYGLIHYLVRHIFAPAPILQAAERPTTSAISLKPHYYIFDPTGHAPDTGLEYAGLQPAQITMRLDCRRLNEAKSSWQPLLTKLPLYVQAAGPRYLLLEYFDDRVDQLVITRQKTELLRELTQHADLYLVLISRVHPMAFVGRAQPLDNHEQTTSQLQQYQAGEALLNELHQFRLLHLPLQPDIKVLAAEFPAFDHFLKRECGTLPFLQHLKSDLCRSLNRLQQAGYHVERATVVTTVRRMAQLYFRGLWRQLSAHEQFLLLDLAQDGIINTHNTLVIDSLLRKGYLIIGNDERLRVASEGFRAYILSAVPSQQALRFEQQERKEGTWARLSLPILLVLSSAAIFLAATQGETLGVAQQYLALLTGVLPLLLRLLSGSSTPSVPEDLAAR